MKTKYTAPLIFQRKSTFIRLKSKKLFVLNLNFCHPLTGLAYHWLENDKKSKLHSRIGVILYLIKEFHP